MIIRVGSGRRPPRDAGGERDVSTHRVRLVSFDEEGGRMLPDGEREPYPELVITLAPDVYRQVLEAAASEGVSVSAWMAVAARRVLKARDGLAAVPPRPRPGRLMTPGERSAARRRIAISASDDPSTESGNARRSG